MNPVYLIYFVLGVIGLIILWTAVRCFFKRVRCCLSIRRTRRWTGGVECVAALTRGDR